MGILDALDQASQGVTQRSRQALPSSSVALHVPARARSTISSAEAGPSRVREPAKTTEGFQPTRATTANGSASTSSSGLERWSLAELQTEARKYGFRAVGDRNVLVAQVQAAHRAVEERRKQEQEGTRPYLSQSGSSAIVIDDDDTIGAITLMSDDFDGNSDEEVGDLTAGLIEEEHLRQGHSTIPSTQRKDRQERVPHPGQRSYDTEADSATGDDNDDDDEEEDNDGVDDSDAERDTTPPEPSMGRVPAHVAKQLHDALLADKKLYHRILLFEPVSFDEVSSTMKRAGVTGLRSKETLRNWLDVQCICFYSSDLTGQRQRY